MWEKCFKYIKDADRIHECHPILKMIIFDMQWWCHLNNVPFKITSTKSTENEDNELKRVSKTHLEGRAIDLSIVGWDITSIKKFKESFDKKYIKEAAYSILYQNPTLVVYHKGTADHLHVQIHARYYSEDKQSSFI